MIEHNNLEKLINSFAAAAASLKIGYIEIATGSGEQLTSLYFKSFIPDFEIIPLKTLGTRHNFGSENKEETVKLTVPSINETKVKILISSAIITSEVSGYIIFQSYDEIPESSEKVMLFFTEAFEIINQLSTECIEEKVPADKYKKELVNMRDFQAKLFPRFADVKGFDIASAYLPADLMSGNFIDGLYLDEDTYQVTVCDVSKYGATSTFTGAMIRTILKYEATKKITPSLLIETINNKIKSMSSLPNEQIYITTYQIKLKTGKTVLSSYGPITTFLYNSQKKGHVNLKNTEAGKLLSKRNFYKDISLTMTSGDILLYYSNGFCNATTEKGGIVYGESRIGEKIIELKDETAMDIIHGLIDSLYEFSNYSSNIEDIILICIKKE
jgi:serine phosphatase RsbU (regulator of sigma subunit)